MKKSQGGRKSTNVEEKVKKWKKFQFGRKNSTCHFGWNKKYQNGRKNTHVEKKFHFGRKSTNLEEKVTEGKKVTDQMNSA